MIDRICSLPRPADLDMALGKVRAKLSNGQEVEAGKTLIAISEKTDGKEALEHKNFFAVCALFGAALLQAYADDPAILGPTSAQAARAASSLVEPG